MTISAQQLFDDLLWTVNSPSIIAPSGHRESKIAINQINVDDLFRNFSDSEHYRVGRYFESLVEFWLRNVRRLEILEHQKQIFEGTRTLGEIDFIYRDENEQTIHLETAVKFYLHYEGEHRSGSHFIGPNSNDNLEAKHRRLFDHQLKLGRKHYNRVTRSEAFVKGRIFYHGDSETPKFFPDILSPDHLQGHWIYVNELDWLDNFEPEARYQVLQKPHWLAEMQFHESKKKYIIGDDLRKLARTHFEDSIRPLLIARLKQGDDQWVEVSRFFIVHSGWPHLKRK